MCTNNKTHCLQCLRNLYGGKDASRTWFQHLKSHLTGPRFKFKQSKQDECVFYRGSTVLLVYTDDCIIIDKHSAANIDSLISELSQVFDVEDEGKINDYLGVRVNETDDHVIELTQPQLIDSILTDLGLLNQDEQSNVKATPAVVNQPMGPDLLGPEFDYDWDYRSIIGKLNFLEKSTRPDISCAVHQCARFMAHPKKIHGAAVKRIGRYLLGTRNKGIHIKPRREEGYRCYVDASFCGDWNKATAIDDIDTAKSRQGFILSIYGMPLYWSSKMQTMITFSTAEAEYLALSSAARYAISISYLLDEINREFHPISSTPQFVCSMFEDNTAALEIAKVPKMRPRTKHINVSYHFFRNEVEAGRLLILPVDTKDQRADILTKAVDEATLQRHRKTNQGF